MRTLHPKFTVLPLIPDVFLICFSESRSDHRRARLAAPSAAAAAFLLCVPEPNATTLAPSNPQPSTMPEPSGSGPMSRANRGRCTQADHPFPARSLADPERMPNRRLPLTGRRCRAVGLFGGFLQCGVNDDPNCRLFVVQLGTCHDRFRFDHDARGCADLGRGHRAEIDGLVTKTIKHSTRY